MSAQTATELLGYIIENTAGFKPRPATLGTLHRALRNIRAQAIADCRNGTSRSSSESAYSLILTLLRVLEGTAPKRSQPIRDFVASWRGDAMLTYELHRWRVRGRFGITLRMVD